MANPRPRQEAISFVTKLAKATGKSFEIKEKPGKDGWVIVYAVEKETDVQMCIRSERYRLCASRATDC